MDTRSNVTYVYHGNLMRVVGRTWKFHILYMLVRL